MRHDLENPLNPIQRFSDLLNTLIEQLFYMGVIFQGCKITRLPSNVDESSVLLCTERPVKTPCSVIE